MNTRYDFRLFVYCIVAVTVQFLLTGSAFAHKVSIFAWIEGDTVFTQSKFSGGRKVQNSTVVVYDSQGNRLLEGKTDKNGEFSFKVPQMTEIKVALKASMGHMAEWTIPAEEIAASLKKEKLLPNLTPKVTTVDPEITSKYASGFKPERLEKPSGEAALDQQKLEEIVEKLLDKKLAPITHMLADSMDCGPGLADVVGGIGYIFGLVGIALYVANRRRND